MLNLTLGKVKTLTVTAVHSRYIIRCMARNLSEKTVELYKVHYSVLRKFLSSDDFLITDLTPSILDEFILYLKSRGCNDITVLSYMRDIRAFMYYCMEEGYIPEFKIRLPKAEKRIKETYSDTELAMLLKKPDLKKRSDYKYRYGYFIDLDLEKYTVTTYQDADETLNSNFPRSLNP